MMPQGLLAQGTDEEKAKAAAVKPLTQTKMTHLLEKVVQAYDCSLVESTTSWLFDRDEIESSKKIVIAPGEGAKGDGVPAVGEVWGVEMGVSLGTGKVKVLEQRPTLHRRAKHVYQLTRPTSRKVFSEVAKRFHHFPFSLRQLENERDAKAGVVECVRSNVFRQYEVVGDKDAAPVARLLTTIGACTHTHTYIHTYIHACMHVCMYVCIHFILLGIDDVRLLYPSALLHHRFLS